LALASTSPSLRPLSPVMFIPSRSLADLSVDLRVFAPGLLELNRREAIALAEGQAWASAVLHVGLDDPATKRLSVPAELGAHRRVAAVGQPARLLPLPHQTAARSRNSPGYTLGLAMSSILPTRNGPRRIPGRFKAAGSPRPPAVPRFAATCGDATRSPDGRACRCRRARAGRRRRGVRLLQ
jgi:hypothetical protein